MNIEETTHLHAVSNKIVELPFNCYSRCLSNDVKYLGINGTQKALQSVLIITKYDNKNQTENKPSQIMNKYK